MIFYYVWSIAHQAWLRPAYLGYTSKILAAGYYSEDNARALVEHENCCMIPISSIKRRRLTPEERDTLATDLLIPDDPLDD